MTPSTETAPAEDVSAALSAIEARASENVDEAPGVEDDSPINFNRSGHLPSLETIETVLETPEEPQGPPSLIGSYSSAGANYKIFSDGSIEAETGEGTFQFASMSDFKRHLSETKAKTASRRIAPRFVWVFLGSGCFATKTPILSVGFPWISLDSLVQIVTYQWVTRIFREKKILAPFSPAEAPKGARGRLGIQKAQDCSSHQLNLISAFPQ